jgi:hypothetical protein
MTDVERAVAESFERIFPVPAVVADWGDVLSRSGGRNWRPPPRSDPKWSIRATPCGACSRMVPRRPEDRLRKPTRRQ